MSTTNEIKTRIKLKRDTETNWETASDKTILDGELILVDSDDGRLRAKIGDGQTAYSGLGFVDHIHIVTEDNKEDPIPANAILVVDTTAEEMISSPVGGGGTGGTGEGGVSPTVTVTVIKGGHTLTITDVNGTKSFSIMDGDDGYSPTVSTSSITGGHQVQITDANGTKTFNVMDGKKGEDYVLTDADKAEIVNNVLGALPEWTGGRY